MRQAGERHIVAESQHRSFALQYGGKKAYKLQPLSFRRKLCFYFKESVQCLMLASCLFLLKNIYFCFILKAAAYLSIGAFYIM